MEIPQELLDYITKEQEAGLAKSDEHKDCIKTYGDEYYHGYYNGYLVALYNIKALIASIIMTC